MPCSQCFSSKGQTAKGQADNGPCSKCLSRKGQTEANFGLHADELQLLLCSALHTAPRQQATHSCLYLDGCLLLGEYLYQSIELLKASLQVSTHV